MAFCCATDISGTRTERVVLPQLDAGEYLKHFSL